MLRKHDFAGDARKMTLHVNMHTNFANLPGILFIVTFIQEPVK